MMNYEQLFHGRLSEFFQHFRKLNSERSFGEILFEFIEWYKWYEPELKFLIESAKKEGRQPKETPEDTLYDQKNIIEKSNCDEDEIIKSPKKKYTPKIWACTVCDYTGTIKNRLNHERTDKHKMMLKEFQEVGVEVPPTSDTINEV